jgi:alginate O-acetyltransferase complex protein AlgJ
MLVLTLLFFFGPGVAALSGVRAEQIENRPLTPFPSIHDGWKALPEVGAWATDHLAGRKQAVAANTALNQLLFAERAGDTVSAKAGGYPQVIQGRDGWLFLGDDVSVRCRSRADPAELVARMRRLSDLVTKSGRRFAIMIAPDKSTIYPQYLPESYLGRACAPAFTTRFWSAFAKNPTPGNVDIRTLLLAEARKSDRLLYRPRDSHWNLQGISLEAALLAHALDPALQVGTRVVDEGTYRPVGDLTRLLGAPERDQLPAMTLVRDGVTLSPGSELALQRNKVTHVRYVSTSAPLYQPKTLILGDSFTDTSKYAVSQYFADLTLLHNRSATKRVAAAMIDRDTVIVQMGERLAITGNNLLLSDAALKDFAQVLAAHPRKGVVR